MSDSGQTANNPPLTPRLSFTVHPGQGPYLLLVHGFLSSSAQWILNLDALGKVCQPVTVDLWGHGKSPAPEDRHLYTTAHYGEQFEYIRTTLGVDQWFVCGYSLGASLTLNYTFAYPQRVIAQVFSNSTSAFSDQKLVDGWLQKMEKSAAKILAGGIDAVNKIPVHPRRAHTLPKPVFDALLADAESLSPIGVANTYLGTMPHTHILEIAHTNPRPTLMCWGQKERRFRPLAQWAIEHMSNLNVVELEAGHGVNMEASGAFNLAVCDFLQRHQTA